MAISPETTISQPVDMPSRKGYEQAFMKAYEAAQSKAMGAYEVAREDIELDVKSIYELAYTDGYIAGFEDGDDARQRDTTELFELTKSYEKLAENMAADAQKSAENAAKLQAYRDMSERVCNELLGCIEATKSKSGKALANALTDTIVAVGNEVMEVLDGDLPKGAVESENDD